MTDDTFFRQKLANIRTIIAGLRQFDGWLATHPGEDVSAEVAHMHNELNVKFETLYEHLGRQDQMSPQQKAEIEPLLNELTAVLEDLIRKNNTFAGNAGLLIRILNATKGLPATGAGGAGTQAVQRVERENLEKAYKITCEIELWLKRDFREFIEARQDIKKIETRYSGVKLDNGLKKSLHALHSEEASLVQIFSTIQSHFINTIGLITYLKNNARLPPQEIKLRLLTAVSHIEQVKTCYSQVIPIEQKIATQIVALRVQHDALAGQLENVERDVYATTNKIFGFTNELLQELEAAVRAI